MSAPLDILKSALGSEDQAKRALAALADSGYVCVPREPTAAMLSAAFASVHDEDAKGTWRDMIESWLME